jgi:hypothetical protein
MTLENSSRPISGSWPARGWLGLGLTALFWALNWKLDGPRTQYCFFPLWLGYSLTVDALVFARKGESMLSRSRRGWLLLFLFSVPAWWLFELLNLRTQNWEYLGRDLFSDLEFALYATLNFSTVMPAVFGTAELAGTLGPIRNLKRGRTIEPSRRVLAGMSVAGWTMLALLLLRPRYFFPFLWGSLYLIIEPVNVRLGNRSLFRYLRDGDWRPVIALACGALVCGFFWEMWNYFSYPKWTYEVPFVGFLRIFEMPVLGYLGYPPFALQLYAIYNLLAGLTGAGRAQRTVRIHGL